MARWWREPADIESITSKYAPSIEGAEPTEVCIIEVDGRPAGVIQRYRHRDHPAWDRAVGIPAAAGIDYYLGEPELVGRGLGTAAIAAFARETLVRYPDVDCVVAAPQQANVASWRALEKAGFKRVWAGRLDSDDPADDGPAYVYVLRRPGPQRVRIPSSLRWLENSDEGRAWLEDLPALLEQAVERWSLRIGPSYTYAFASLAMPALLPNGGQAVLKLSFPHRESRHEATALRLWAGRGAIRLLDHDPVAGALLLERCIPGAPLSGDVGHDNHDGDALDVMAGLLPRLWVPAGAPFTALAEEAAWWASYLESRWEGAGRPFPRALLVAALDAIQSLAGSQSEQVLVNQDLHAGNVLRAEREPWLVIDPKPLAGEREFGIASVIRDPALGHSRGQVVARLDRLCAELSLDRERARGWALAQTVAWSFDGAGVLPSHVEVAGWLHEAR